MKKLPVLLFIFLLAMACKNDKTTGGTTIAQNIAYKNGFEHWENVSEIQFTFNVDRDSAHFERSWTWKPKSGDVVMMDQKDTVRYNRSQMDSLVQKTDAAFINDKYWLLAPFNLAWDEGTTFSEQPDVVSPISKDTLNLLTMVYSGKGGYTPGDAYDFYYDDDFMIREWTYRRGNDSLPTVSTTWEGYETFKNITISTMHKDGTGDFKLYFTNVSVK